MDPHEQVFYADMHPFDLLFDDVTSLGTSILGEMPMQEVAGRIKVAHFPIDVSKPKCFTLDIERRTSKPLGTSRKTNVTLAPMQRFGAKKAFMKKHGGDFEVWVERAVERNRLMIDISEDGSEV